MSGNECPLSFTELALYNYLFLIQYLNSHFKYNLLVTENRSVFSWGLG